MLKRNKYSKFKSISIILTTQMKVVLRKIYRLTKINFITGLFLLLPSFITIFILAKMFIYLDEGPFGTFITNILGRRIPGIGVFLTIMFVILCGVAARNFIGKQLFLWIETTIEKIPLAKHIIVPIKQLSETLFTNSKMIFDKVVIVEYPRRDAYSIGFVTADAAEGISNAVEKDLVSVFVATTPNPTSGYMIMVPRDDVIYLDITPEEGMKLVISAGFLTPDKLKGELELP